MGLASTISRPSQSTKRRIKYALWTAMALATISVVFYSEVPLFKQPQEKVQLHLLRWILIPHAVAGVVALISGPFQFSDRLRRRHLRFHRILGRLYVASVGLAAPLAIISTEYSHYPKAAYFKVAIVFQAGAWMLTTSNGIYAALKRSADVHREWMVRSYAVTFTFVATRVLQPVPAWNHLGRFWFAVAIICITCVALLIPQIARSSRPLAVRPI